MDKMAISQAILEEIHKIEKLFSSKNSFPECKNIDKKTIENFKQIPKGREYPSLIKEYTWLEKYCCNTIYIFSVNNFPYDLKEMIEIKEKVKKENISLFRINETSSEWEKVKSDKTVCLYVGSSKNIRERLKEHLFLYNQTANAMHLEKLFPKDLPLTISTWDLEAFLKDRNPEYLQNIEDILWNHYKPLLGKQGKK